MFRKINNVFCPNHRGHRSWDSGDGCRLEHDYHSACTVRLVRSTSMLVLGEKKQRQEDRIWLYSQNQNCLEYLEALVALRRQYVKSMCDLKSKDTKATVSKKKKKSVFPAPKDPVSFLKPFAPPVPNEEETLQYLDDIIASCDSETQRKPYMDNGHGDVDFIVASSSAEHDLHSNWVLRVPRNTGDSEQAEVHVCANKKGLSKKDTRGSTNSRLRLQRNPIHLPKAVTSAFQTLRIKPKLKKK